MELRFDTNLCRTIGARIIEKPAEVREEGVDRFGHYNVTYFGGSPTEMRCLVTIEIDAEHLEGYKEYLRRAREDADCRRK